MPRRPGRAIDVTPGRIVLAGVAAVLVLSGTRETTPPTWSVLPPADTGVLGATGTPPEDDPGSATVPQDPLPGPGGSAGPGAGSDGPQVGIPGTVLAAYKAAEAKLATVAPGCHLPWSLVAGIGRIESSHARGGAVTADGTTRGPILGPRLDGSGGNASIRDTDRGVLDRDTVWDRAVGPTQFIPSTWRGYGADGNTDGRVDPNNVFDAAVATGRYLCAGGLDVATARGQHDAVFRYNHSEAYVARVLAWARAYAAGSPVATPDSTGSAAGSSDDGSAGSGSSGSASLADGPSSSSGAGSAPAAASSPIAAARVPAPVVAGPVVVLAPVVPPAAVPPAAAPAPVAAPPAAAPPAAAPPASAPPASAPPASAPPASAPPASVPPASVPPASAPPASAPPASAPPASAAPATAPPATAPPVKAPPATAPPAKSSHAAPAPPAPRTTVRSAKPSAPRPAPPSSRPVTKPPAPRATSRVSTPRTTPSPTVDPVAVCTAAAPLKTVAAQVAPAKVLRVRAEVVGDVVRCTAVTSTGTVLVATRPAS